MEQGLEAGAYDVMVAPDLCDQDTDVEAVLQHISKLSKLGSWLYSARQAKQRTRAPNGEGFRQERTVGVLAPDYCSVLSGSL